MTVIERLSSSLNHRDTSANIVLALGIIRTRDSNAVRELVEHLTDKNKRLASDCIKTLYEIGEREPKLIADYVDEFAALLTSKTQRLVWGGMCALDCCASVKPEDVHAHLKAILKAADGESVIARDHAVTILTKLSTGKHAQECVPLMLDIIRTAPINQWPTYAEKAASVAPSAEREALAALIFRRLPSITAHKTKSMRMQKLLKLLNHDYADDADSQDWIRSVWKTKAISEPDTKSPKINPENPHHPRNRGSLRTFVPDFIS